MSLRILLVEDEPLWQEGIKALISICDGWEVVAVADEYEAALQAFDATQPDVVLLDWKIRGDKDGLKVGESLVDKGFEPSRIILVTGSHPSLIPDLPYGYVPKQSIGAQLTDTIRSVTKS
jgi:DNA-binding NarL/FixJ family response regulator